MKESYWGYWLIVLGVFIVVILLLVQNFTTNNTQDYYLIKSISESSMIDAIDYGYYMTYGELKMNKEKFFESFLRRFSEEASVATTYHITFTDVYEAPPKIGVEVSSKSNAFTITGSSDSFDIVNKIDGILELGTGTGVSDVNMPVTKNTGSKRYIIDPNNVSDENNDYTPSGGNGENGGTGGTGGTNVVKFTKNPLNSLRITSCYSDYRGTNGIAGATSNHHAVDFDANCETDVYAGISGYIVNTGYDGSRGNYVDIKSNNGYTVRYQHLQNIIVSSGQVNEDTIVAKSGQTGVGSCHLHVEMWNSNNTSEYLNPVNYLNVTSEQLKRYNSFCSKDNEYACGGSNYYIDNNYNNPPRTECLTSSAWENWCTTNNINCGF